MGRRLLAAIREGERRREAAAWSRDVGVSYSGKSSSAVPSLSVPLSQFANGEAATRMRFE